MNSRSKTPGISRIDQPSHHTHGFFVRLQGEGKLYSTFFSDKKYGGRDRALFEAQFHLAGMQLKYGLSPVQRRQRLAEAVRRKNRSGIVGVRRVEIKHSSGCLLKYWQAHWSPLRGVYRRKQFSIRKHGEEKARELAIKARRDGVRAMK